MATRRSRRLLSGGAMFSRCANPDCLAPFDYHAGRFFRFHKEHRCDERPANTHSVQHFWLCENCSGSMVLDYRDELGVLIAPRHDIAFHSDEQRLIAAA